MVLDTLAHPTFSKRANGLASLFQGETPTKDKESAKLRLGEASVSPATDAFWAFAGIVRISHPPCSLEPHLGAALQDVQRQKVFKVLTSILHAEAVSHLRAITGFEKVLLPLTSFGIPSTLLLTTSGVGPVASVILSL